MQPSSIPIRQEPQSVAEGMRGLARGRRNITALTSLLPSHMSIHRRSVAAYVAEARHLDQHGAKTLKQMGREIGTTKDTVRRWLRRDHWDLWMEHWASVEEIWDDAQRDRLRRDGHQQDVVRRAEERRKAELKASLDQALADVMARVLLS